MSSLIHHPQVMVYHRLKKALFSPLVLVLLLILVGFGATDTTHAQSAYFSSSIVSKYSFQPDSSALVSHEIKLSALQPNIFPTNFTLEVELEKLSNLVAYMGDTQLDVQGTTILLPPPNEYQVDTVFSVSYKLLDSVRHKGNLEVVSVPLFHSSGNIRVDDLQLTVSVPIDWGEVSVSTTPFSYYEENETEKILYFEIKPDELKAINRLQELQVVFGEEQLYNVELTYQLQNTDSDKELIHTVAFPPVFKGLQQVYVDSILPLPDDLEIDPDGNILGKYILQPGERKDVVFKGQVMIYQREASFQTKEPVKLVADQRYLIADQYWETNAEPIAYLAKELQTPSAIYDYVTTHLKYDEEKVLNLDIERVGALASLSDPDAAACMEFTDLMIAILRSAGIPAREVDGYAYLEDDELMVRPRVTDVLHSWVQYWDDVDGWINVDPTWGSSTGRDYFNQFDHDHLIFVMKGINSTYPYPAGAYRLDTLNTQNVRVELASSMEPVGISFSDWIGEYQHNALPWWQKIWLWFFGLFG